MRAPRAQDLPDPLRGSALWIAQRIAGAGGRAWIVGGPVRDLVLSRPPMDLDMASALLPEQIEALFERTSAVGKAFGTVLVHLPGLDVQVTTFRRERGFSDARRPDLVEYALDPEQDACRRDFTCNALYLDPLNEELCDPVGGLADMAARRLRAVGDARARFAEDGLRLVRLARFSASLQFEVEQATLDAARDSRAALSGVSPERRLAELVRIFDSPRSTLALSLLAQGELLTALLPGFSTISPDAFEVARRLRVLDELEPDNGRGPGAGLGLATLLCPVGAAAMSAAQDLLEYLRPSRGLRAEVEALWRLGLQARELGTAERTQRVRFARSEHADAALRLARAWTRSGGGDDSQLAELERFAVLLSPGEKFPVPWLCSADLATAGVPRGPAWRELLEQAESEQIEGRLPDREAALRWLQARAEQLRQGS